MKYVNNFWRLLERWQGAVRTKSDDYCGKCYLPHCLCHVERIPYTEALEEVRYWMGINIMLALREGGCFIHENPGYDMDYVYPTLPPIQPGPCRGAEVVLPAEKPVAYILRGDRSWLYDGEVADATPPIKLDQGITWGHWVGGTFYPLARFTYPYWFVIQNDTPPTGVKATMATVVPVTEGRLCV